MTLIVIHGIGQLVTNSADALSPDTPTSEFGDLGIIEHAGILVRDGKIIWIGFEKNLRAAMKSFADESERIEHIDIQGKTLIPGFVDSHSHLVFAGDRGGEFEARMSGRPYDGGGIMRTVEATRAADDDTLIEHTAKLINEARSQGTTTIEIKTGYGLSPKHEPRLASIAQQFTPEVTFLGGHAIPSEYRGAPGNPDTIGTREDYVDLVCGPMLDAITATGAAKWVDVFCEPHSPFAFDGDETRRILAAGISAHLIPRLHGAQLGEGPGPQIAVEFDAASVDHCTFLTDNDLDALAGSWDGNTSKQGTVATFLPAVEFSTKQPYPDMQRAIDAGCRVAIASDCNPGTCFSDSMPFAIAIAVREMGLTIPQAIWAATAGGALALRRNDIGSIRIGAAADFAVVDAPSYTHIAYRPGVPLTHALNLPCKKPRDSSALPRRQNSHHIRA